MHTRIWIVVALALTASAAWAETTYVVKQGDRLIDICRAHDVSLAEVVRLNRIKDANLILPGQRIRLPDAGEATGAASLPRAADSAEQQRLSTSTTLPFVNYGSMGSNLRAVSQVKIAEEVLEKLQQAPPNFVGGFQMAAQLGEIMLRAPVADRALVGGMLALILTPYSAALASSLGTMPTFAMDGVFPAAKTAIGEVIKTTLSTYGRTGALGAATSALGAASDVVGAASDAVSTASEAADAVQGAWDDALGGR
ncbi:MAG: LysM peptidoglycan-binding domain-containing protein [Planctomycetes bacterium]|nr:LysM peptidoglycan-binding domain-containing protein [Planctomycetota bacterium]